MSVQDREGGGNQSSKDDEEEEDCHTQKGTVRGCGKRATNATAEMVHVIASCRRRRHLQRPHVVRMYEVRTASTKKKEHVYDNLPTIVSDPQRQYVLKRSRMTFVKNDNKIAT